MNQLSKWLYELLCKAVTCFIPERINAFEKIGWVNVEWIGMSQKGSLLFCSLMNQHFEQILVEQIIEWITKKGSHLFNSWIIQYI